MRWFFETALPCLLTGAVVGLVAIDYIRMMGGAKSILAGW